ncbi:venom metalloproteinase antarease-like TtrivMP_A [Ixodes scapularis]
MGPLLRTLAVASCMVLAGTAPNRGTTTPLYYMPLFETETEVYPEVLHYGDENTVVQIVEGYELHLHHTAIFPPRVLVRTFKDGEPIDRVMRTTDIRKEIFCDDSNGATLMIRRNRESNQTTVEGIIDNELRIMPNKDPNAKKNSHKVYRVKDKSSHVLDSILTNNQSLAEDISINEVTKRAIANKTIFVRPEVVVIVDSAHASRFRSRGDLLRYMGVFMNAVNLRYSTAAGLDIQIKLTAIVISSPDQETYFKYTGNHVNADQTLAGFTLRLATGYIPGNFDFAYLLTGRDIAQVTQSGSVHPAVAGVAYIGGACTVQRTGMGEDVPGTYDGVHVATHEMAHLMGCVHDGDPPPDYLSDSPGAQDCPWDDGFIMSYKDGGQNHYMFSQCCVAQIKHLLQRGSHNCLLEQYNRPLKMDKRLPGELLSPVDYCRLRFPEIPYVWTDANPADLMQCKIRCSYPVNPYTGLYVYRQANALDGTTCAEGKRCINGVCG